MEGDCDSNFHSNDFSLAILQKSQSPSVGKTNSYSNLNKWDKYEKIRRVFKLSKDKKQLIVEIKSLSVKQKSFLCDRVSDIKKMRDLLGEKWKDYQINDGIVIFEQRDKKGKPTGIYKITETSKFGDVYYKKRSE